MRRSMLFIPGNAAGMLLNVDVLGADSVVLDLEDAVSPDKKDEARILVRNALKYLRYSSEIIIRINSIDTMFWKSDLQELIPLRPYAVMLPKINSAADVRMVTDYIKEIEEKHSINNPIQIIPLIETALGVENAFEIVKFSDRVRAVMLGAEDLASDLRCKRTKKGDEIFYSRGRLITAARAAGIDAYDTPFIDADDEEGLRDDALLAKSLGFAGKAAMSPRQIAIINELFSPTIEEIEYAREIMDMVRGTAQQGSDIISLRGKTIDPPIASRARQTLEMAGQAGGSLK